MNEEAALRLWAQRQRLETALLSYRAFVPERVLLRPKQSLVTVPRIGWVRWQAATAPRVRYLGGPENFVPVVRHIS